MSVFDAVSAHVDGLRAQGSLDTEGEALAEVALMLARDLDGAKARTMSASWARELRATLAGLGKGHDDSDADSWLDGLRTEVLDSKV